ncbi:MAG: GNAT family protein [Gammaproteobacteria bacterium]|nr:GNAT family protein [Gammaproteobacteria bacterium]
MPKTIRTERLLLRPVSMDDLDVMMEFANHPEWGRYQQVPQPFRREHARDFLAHFERSDWTEGFCWAIEFDGKYAGAVSMHVYDVHKTASIGFDLNPQLWKRGLTTEATREVVDRAFGSLRLRKVWATADAPNIASIRVLEKLGMQREGLQREHHWRRGKPVDIVLYGVLGDEWKELAG